MADKPQDLLAAARKERAQIARAGVKDAAGLLKKVDAGLGAIAATVNTHAQLLKDLETLQALQRRVEAESKALAQRVKTTLDKGSPGQRELGAALDAVRIARRESKPAGVALAKLDAAMADLGMVLRDYSPFQDLPGR